MATVALGAAAFVGVSAGGPRPPSATGAITTAPNRPTTAPSPPAPNGSFTVPGGPSMTIASLRGTPTMVWFVAGGCASCAASIPAVAQHFTQLHADGVKVVTLGLAGDFSPGAPGASQVVSFGTAAASGKVQRPGWIWGVASKALSLAYDPTGQPDVYAVIGKGGHIRYTNSVPDSTMPQLLAAAARLTGHPVGSATPGGLIAPRARRTAHTPATLP